VISTRWPSRSTTALTGTPIFTAFELAREVLRNIDDELHLAGFRGGCGCE